MLGIQRNASAARKAALIIFRQVKGTSKESGMTDSELREYCSSISKPRTNSQPTPETSGYQGTFQDQGSADFRKPKKQQPAPVSPLAQLRQPTPDMMANLNILPNPNRIKPDSKDIWNDISRFNQEQQEKERVEKARQKKLQKQLWQKQLNRQIKEAEDAESRKKKEVDDYASQKADELEQWKKQERQKMANKRAQIQEQNRLQSLQRQAQDRKKAEEQARKNADDQKTMARLRAQMEADNRKMLERKMTEKEKMERVKLENKHNLSVKAQKREQQRQFDMKLQADYVAMENKKEADRAASFKQMSDRIEAKMQMGADVIAAVDNKERENEERARREQKAYDIQREKEDEVRRARAKQRTDEQLSVLKKQVEEREAMLARDQQEQQDQARLWKQQTDEYDQAERKKQNMMKQRNMSQKKWLEHQIKAKANALGTPDQSNLELQLNRSILNKIGHTRMQQSNSGMDIAYETRARSREIENQQARAERDSQAKGLTSLDKRSQRF